MVDPNPHVTQAYYAEQGYVSRNIYFDTSLPKYQVGLITSYRWLAGFLLSLIGVATKVKVMGDNDTVVSLYVNKSSLNDWINKYGNLVRDIADHPIENKINAICRRLILQKSQTMLNMDTVGKAQQKQQLEQSDLSQLKSSMQNFFKEFGIDLERIQSEQDEFVDYVLPAFCQELEMKAKNLDKEDINNIIQKYPDVIKYLAETINAAQRTLSSPDVNAAGLLERRLFLILEVVVKDIIPRIKILMDAAYLEETRIQFQEEEDLPDVRMLALKKVDELSNKLTEIGREFHVSMNDALMYVQGEDNVKTIAELNKLLSQRNAEGALVLRDDLARAQMGEIIFSLSSDIKALPVDESVYKKQMLDYLKVQAGALEQHAEKFSKFVDGLPKKEKIKSV